MITEDMDDCPVCERETVYNGERCTVCGRLWGIDYDADDITERLAREKAERIAAEQIATPCTYAYYLAETLDDDGREDLRLALARTALAALIEKENAS